MIVRVETPDPPAMLEAEKAVVGPEGETVVVRVTVPVKPFEGVIVIADVPVLPACTVTVVGLEVIVKSGAGGVDTVTCIVTE